MWFFLAIIGYFFLAIVILLDKIILTKSVPRPALYTFYSTIFLLPLFFLTPWHVVPRLEDIYLSIVSGILFGLALWAGFRAIKDGEASHLGPFTGACITIFSFVLGALFLQESLSHVQKIGVAVLISASLLLSTEKSKKHNGFHMGFVWGMLSGLLFAASHVSAKYMYEVYPFMTGLIWTKGSVGLVGLGLLCLPSVRKLLKPKPIHKTKLAKKSHKKRFGTVIIVVINKILSVIANVLIQYAIAIGSVTVVNAISGIQYACLFALILLFSRYGKKYFQEYFTRRELVTESIAIVLIMLGAYLCIF